MEYDHQFLQQRERSSPPVNEGFVYVELSNKPVPYHISRCFEGIITASQAHAIALSSCRISCMATDVARGRLPMNTLQRSVTTPCINRLGMMAALLNKARAAKGGEPGGRMGLLPVIPQSMNGMLLSPMRVEMTVHLTIGANHHWSNLVLQHMGSRWMCVMVDIG